MGGRIAEDPIAAVKPVAVKPVAVKQVVVGRISEDVVSAAPTQMVLVSGDLVLVKADVAANHAVVTIEDAAIDKRLRPIEVVARQAELPNPIEVVARQAEVPRPVEVVASQAEVPSPIEVVARQPEAPSPIEVVARQAEVPRPVGVANLVLAAQVERRHDAEATPVLPTVIAIVVAPAAAQRVRHRCPIAFSIKSTPITTAR